MSETVTDPKNGEEHDAWIPFRLLNDAPREHRFDMNTVDLPTEIVNNIERLAVDIFDPGSGNVIVIGVERAGKTFLVEQLIGNQAQYTKNTHYFIEVREIDLGILMGLTDTFTSFASEVANVLDVHPDKIVYVTGNNNVATSFAASGSSQKMIFEAQVSAYQKLMTDDSAYENGSWSKWNAIDVNEVALNRDQLTAMLHNMQMHTNESAATKNQVDSLVGKILSRRPSMVKKNDVIAAPPGLFAVILRRAARMMKHTKSKDYQTPKGNPSWSKITQGVVEEFLDYFDPFAEEGRRGHLSEIGDQVQEIIDDMMNSGGGDVPGQIIISHGVMENPENETSTEEAKEEDGRAGIQWNDMTTLAARMKKSVFGQEEAIEQIVRELTVSAAGLNDAEKPLGSFMLMGPTGVGKTMIAKTLAKELLEDGMDVLRLDMSEYSQHFEAAKLFGVPAGYVGFDEGGILTNAIQKNPRTLILLDEAEKAHQQIWNSFLQVFDAGRMTTATGEVVDFSQTVIVMTSNLGSQQMSRGISGFTPMGAKNGGSTINREAIASSAAKEFFRPEFLGRIDSILTVNPLGDATAYEIVHEELRIVFERAKVAYQPVSDEVVEYLLKKSNVAEYGAREVQRTIRREVAIKLSQALLQKPQKTKSAPKVFSMTLSDEGDIQLK